MNDSLAFREGEHAAYNGKERSKGKRPTGNHVVVKKKGTKCLPLNSERKFA